jgi:glycerophosphoryl diester phosphodiesterase
MSDVTLRRVGHKGAELIAPGNTPESFAAALAAGVDMIEFDVLPERFGATRLVLAHDFEDAAQRGPLTLEVGLELLAGSRFAGVEFNVDLKLPGYEDQVLDALRAHDLVGRVLISTQYPSSLARVRAREPAARLGWSVPKLRRDPFRSRALVLPALAGLQAARVGLPGRAASAIRAGYCDALMSHWRLVTPRLVRAVAQAGGELYVWTVNDPEQISRLATLGVTGVITGDPRLFAGLTPAPV